MCIEIVLPLYTSVFHTIRVLLKQFNQVSLIDGTVYIFWGAVSNVFIELTPPLNTTRMCCVFVKLSSV